MNFCNYSTFELTEKQRTFEQFMIIVGVIGQGNFDESPDKINPTAYWTFMQCGWLLVRDRLK